jgi:hypothetical protein
MMCTAFGTCQLLPNFVRGYAAIMAPLTDLLKGINKQDKRAKLEHLGNLPAAEAETLKQQFFSELSTLLPLNIQTPG